VLDDSLREYHVKLADLRRQLAELSDSLTPAHPKVKRVQAQIVSLEAELKQGFASLLTRIRNEYQSAERREKLLTADYATQARLVSDQAGKTIHYGILKREVDANRQLYEAMLQKVKEAGIAAAMRDLTGDFCTSRIETGRQKGTGKCQRKRSRPSRSWVSCVRSKCW
jgi:uncharacterized protein involved in exopolysaccharide biosynthesis